jgi:leucyl aminopeptidase
VLADALTYALRTYAPDWIVDTATLTGSVMAALHEEFAALYASDDRLASQLIQAGEQVGEKLWRMPLDPSQDYLVESDIADVCNLGKPGFYGNAAGSPTAGAKFLERFVSGARWAHIDLNGPAWSTRNGVPLGKGATGYGVRLLDRWLALIEAGRAGLESRGAAHE